MFHSTVSLLPQKIPVSKFLMTLLHVICGLPPQSKILATPISSTLVFSFAPLILILPPPPDLAKLATPLGLLSELFLPKISVKNNFLKCDL